MNTKSIGDISEGFVIAELLKNGFNILLPFGDNCRYDLVVDTKKGLKKLQVKTGRIREGKILFNTRSVNRDTNKSRHYNGQIDYFSVYVPEINQVYMMHVNDSPRQHATLRIDEPKNSQSKGIKLARDYKLCKWVNQFK